MAGTSLFGNTKPVNLGSPKREVVENIEKQEITQTQIQKQEEEKSKKKSIEKKKNVPEKLEEESESVTVKKDTKTRKAKQKDAMKKYLDGKYVLNIPLDKGAEQWIELGGKIYGSKKAYIEKLVHDDAVKNGAQYKEQLEKEESNKWDIL